MAIKYITAVSLMQSKITVNNVNGTEIMKPKVLEIEAYTITETAKLLGYKSTKSIYKLLDRGILNDYIWHEYRNKFGKKKSLSNARATKSSNSCRKDQSKYSS